MKDQASWAEQRQLEVMQRVGRVGYWEYDPATAGFWLPPLSLSLLAASAGIEHLSLDFWTEILADGDRKRLLAALETAVAQGLPLQQELRLKSAREGKTSILLRGAPLEADGPRVRYGGTFHDISREKRAEEEREDVISQLNALLDSLHIGVTLFDRDLRLLFWNDQIYAILGLPRGAVYKYARFEELIIYPARRGEYGPGNPEELVRQRAELARRFEPHRFERLAGDGRTLLVEGYPFGLGANVSGFVTTYTDITGQKQTEEQLQRQNHVLSTIIKNFPGAITLFDADLRLVAHNAQLKELLDLPDSLLSKPDLHFEDLARFNVGRGEYGPGDPEQQVAAILARARNFQPHKFERVRPNGMVLEIRGMPLPNGGFVTIYIDMTERKRAEERIRVMALQDALTGLPNRLNFNDQAQQTLERAAQSRQRFALLFLDLDGFKQVNDSLVHDAGDELLKKVATSLREIVRQTDFVARLGGDEFVVLLHDLIDVTAACNIADSIIARLATPFLLASGSAQIGTSIGIALYPEHGKTREGLLKAADVARYSAKNARNRETVPDYVGNRNP
jgi:diguanylate cyclase (GGDEF)-like protein